MPRPLSLLPLLSALLVPSVALAQNGCDGTLVRHGLGETCVPRNPVRVVVLEWSYTEDLLAVGVQPVGVADVAGYGEWVRVPVRLAANVQDVGTRQAPSLEKIRLLKPDLIVTARGRALQNYAQLSAIAPTLAFDAYAPGQTQYEEMRATFGTLARVVGRAAQAREVLARLDARLAETRRAIERAGRAGETFAVTQAFTSQNVPTARLFTRNAMASQIIERLGLVNAWRASPQLFGFSTVSLEGLAALKTRNFFYIVQEEDNVFVQPQHAPLWRSLAFVKANRAYSLGSRTWLFGGPLSAEVLAEQVRRALLGDS